MAEGDDACARGHESIDVFEREACGSVAAVHVGAERVGVVGYGLEYHAAMSALEKPGIVVGRILVHVAEDFVSGLEGIPEGDESQAFRCVLDVRNVLGRRTQQSGRRRVQAGKNVGIPGKDHGAIERMLFIEACGGQSGRTIEWCDAAEVEIRPSVAVGKAFLCRVPALHLHHDKSGCGMVDSVFFDRMRASSERAAGLAADVSSRLANSAKGDARSFINEADALWLLTEPSLPTEIVLEIAEKVRRHLHGNRVHVHILNNIRNGNCAEDCGYCAQRKSADGIPVYAMKPEDEILREARAARENGAHRYCMVTSGRSTGIRMAGVYADLVRKIHKEVGIRVCLSAGLVEDPEVARVLAEAGLDRYNHNLNTSDSYYGSICSSHSYGDRLKTLELLSANGIGLCSGIIAGMGEERQDIVTVAFELNRLGAASIPVNFFLPVDGHTIQSHMQGHTPLSADDCLRILSVFRLVNPLAEIRMAAGREVYLGERQSDGLRVANSLFMSGYLNVRGSSAASTIRLIYDNGFALDEDCETDIRAFRDSVLSAHSQDESDGGMKSLAELRAFRVETGTTT